MAETHQLTRRKFTQGEIKPTAKAEVLATFPDYGLSYKYGGWHLTRTIAVGGKGKIYVSVGSSCNACTEKEKVRATVLEMNPGGSEQKIYATGLRNAIGLKWGVNFYLLPIKVQTIWVNINLMKLFMHSSVMQIMVGHLAIRRMVKFLQIQNLNVQQDVKMYRLRTPIFLRIRLH